MSNADGIRWPKKTREMSHFGMDSTRWNGFPFRDDDVIVATWGKSGTTWVQQIVAQLIFEGAEGLSVTELAPWLDMSIAPKEEILKKLEAQTHRRIIKTHLPVDALVLSPSAKYLFVARDGRDAVWSYYNHHANHTKEAYDMVNSLPGMEEHPFEPPSDDIRQYFHDWLDKDGHPIWPFWSHIQSWWKIRDLSNVRLLHFNNLKSDLEREMRGIARFLDIELDEALWPVAIEHCTFEYMKEHASTVVGPMEALFEGGGKTFINKGTNGRWHDVLTSADIEKYETAARDSLEPECVRWLATGQLP